MALGPERTPSATPYSTANTWNCSETDLWLLDRRHVIVSDFSVVPKVTPKVPPLRQKRESRFSLFTDSGSLEKGRILRKSRHEESKKEMLTWRGQRSESTRVRGWTGNAPANLTRSSKKVLTCQKNSELLVVELGLLLGQQAALGALSHRVDEAHAGQHHLVTAALIAEAAAAAPTVMLRETRRRDQLISPEIRRIQTASFTPKIQYVQAEAPRNSTFGCVNFTSHSHVELERDGKG